MQQGCTAGSMSVIQLSTSKLALEMYMLCYIIHVGHMRLNIVTRSTVLNDLLTVPPIRAAEIHHGQWSVPEFDCTGFVKKWVVHYTAPFFGWDALRAKLEFK